MSKLVAKPKLDIVFKLLLQENRRLLVRLLGCVLSVPEASITDIDIRNSEILPEEPSFSKPSPKKT